MAAGVLVLVVLVPVLVVLLWLRARPSKVSRDPTRAVVQSQAPTGPMPQPYVPQQRPIARVDTSDIAWGVFVGLWLFTISLGVIALSVLTFVVFVVRSRT